MSQQSTPITSLSSRMVCEQHPDRFWPHHNENGAACAGPGMWHRPDHPMYVKPPYLNDAEWELVTALRGDYQQARHALAHCLLDADLNDHGLTFPQIADVIQNGLVRPAQ